MALLKRLCLRNIHAIYTMVTVQSKQQCKLDRMSPFPCSIVTAGSENSLHTHDKFSTCSATNWKSYRESTDWHLQPPQHHPRTLQMKTSLHKNLEQQKNFKGKTKLNAKSNVV